MSFHNKPEWHNPILDQALLDHGLPVNDPSQLADAFRSGWVSARSGLDPMKDCIGSLLVRTDELVAAPPCQFEIDGVVIPDEGGHSMHAFGMTPDWYVEAALLASTDDLEGGAKA
jgi:hypothetical protein